MPSQAPSSVPISGDPYLIDSHKMHYHYERVSAWARAKSSEEKLSIFPVYVEVSPVGHCNHRCTFCAVDYIGYKTRKIDTPVLNLALDAMGKYGVKSVMFAGEGEPMLHPDIAQITNHAAGAGLDVAFTTNGTALTQKFIDKALHSVKWIKVSMNGGPTSYAQIHQTKPEDYERVWRNLTAAVSAKKASNLQCALGVQCVLLPENTKDLEAIVRRARETGLNYVVIKPYSQHKSSLTHTYEEVSYQSTDMAEALGKAAGYNTGAFKVITRSTAMSDWDKGEHSYAKCLSTPYFWAYIMATGQVYSCSAYLLNPDFCLGDINEQGFAEIWLGPKRRAHLVQMENLDISKCRLNCRMNQVNKFLWDVVHPNPHANFI